MVSQGKVMIFIPRRVQQFSESAESASEMLLEDLRDKFAWVLLGEPGAGKSTAFKEEAKTTNGLVLRIAEFINCDPEPEWNKKTLFLDGLDEVRASSRENSTLLSVRRQLKKLGYPRFRIACRAADWHGS